MSQTKDNSTDWEFSCVPLDDAKNLKAVTEKILFDGVNFCQLINGGSIEVISVKNLWFDVEVISAVSNY